MVLMNMHMDSGLNSYGMVKFN